MTSELFLAQFRHGFAEMRRIAEHRPETGACAGYGHAAVALDLEHLQVTKDADGDKLYHGARQGVTFPLADALCWLLAVARQYSDAMELEKKGPGEPGGCRGTGGHAQFFTDLCHIQTRAPAGEAAASARNWCLATIGILHGTEADKGCFRGDWMPGSDIPGIARCAGRDRRGRFASGQSRAVREMEGLEPFQRLRRKLDGCLTGSQLARDRAAEALTKVMIPEALDYPRMKRIG